MNHNVKRNVKTKINFTRVENKRETGTTPHVRSAKRRVHTSACDCPNTRPRAQQTYRSAIYPFTRPSRHRGPRWAARREVAAAARVAAARAAARAVWAETGQRPGLRAAERARASGGERAECTLVGARRRVAPGCVHQRTARRSAKAAGLSRRTTGRAPLRVSRQASLARAAAPGFWRGAQAPRQLRLELERLPARCRLPLPLTTRRGRRPAAPWRSSSVCLPLSALPELRHHRGDRGTFHFVVYISSTSRPLRTVLDVSSE